ncbi:MAG: MarR family winged helix-turn-helix transcriptional regulator [Gammaproteobacteria bacterium]
MPTSPPGLGMLLRHVLELLDGDLERVYKESGLDYRPRYTPVMRALIDLGPTPIRDIARHASTTHSAASQTVAQMARKGLLRLEPGADARERVVRLTPRARRMLPKLQAQWAATDAAAEALSAELPCPLHDVLIAAIRALEMQPFRERIALSARPSDETQPTTPARAKAGS